MKLYFLCLFVVIATTARPYRYGREEYRPARRYSERYVREPSPVYSRNLPRPIRSLEEEEQNYQVPTETKRPEEIAERRLSQGRTSRSLPKGEGAASYETPEVQEEEQTEKKLIERESEEDDEFYEKNSLFEGAENEADYEELTHEDEGEDLEENEDEEEEYPFEKSYEYQSGYEAYQAESYGHEDEHENNLEHEEEDTEEQAAEHQEREEDEEEHTMLIELADIVFSFPDCNSITCSKAGFEGYGCKDSKCRFICSSEECYEYPDGPTDYEEVIEEVHEEEKTATEEITTTTEATTSTTTTTPEPEPTTQAPKKRRSAVEKRGKSRRPRSRQ